MIKVTGYINGLKYEENILEKNGKQACPVCPQVGKRNIKVSIVYSLLFEMTDIMFKLVSEIFYVIGFSGITA